MNNPEILKKNYEYYLKNHSKLVEKYLDKYIVIKDENVVDSYNTFEEAIEESAKKYELGTFIVQKCSQTIEEDTQVFHSRVMY